LTGCVFCAIIITETKERNNKSEVIDMTAHEIAKDFLDKMNPSRWTGVGEMPNDFDARIVTYEIDGHPDYELDISFDYVDEPEGWMHYCEVRDKETEELMTPMHGDSIHSVMMLETTIKDAISTI
jgi:hypothetical protein